MSRWITKWRCGLDGSGCRQGEASPSYSRTRYATGDDEAPERDVRGRPEIVNSGWAFQPSGLRLPVALSPEDTKAGLTAGLRANQFAALGLRKLSVARVPPAHGPGRCHRSVMGSMYHSGPASTKGQSPRVPGRRTAHSRNANRNGPLGSPPWAGFT